MLPPHQVPNWLSAATSAHLAAQMQQQHHQQQQQMAANSSNERRTPQHHHPSPPPPAPSDPDAPLNLSKPKSLGSGSTETSPQPTPTSQHQSINDQPVAATVPRLMPPNLMMTNRAFLPYAGLPPTFPIPPGVDNRNKSNDVRPNMEKQHHFPMHMYAMPTPPNLGGRPKESEGIKEETDFITACQCEYFITLKSKTFMVLWQQFNIQTNERP